MKAKEYAEIYNKEEDKKEVLRKILHMFLGEVAEICDKRNCRTRSAHDAVVQELHQKWRSFAGQVGNVNRNEFMLFYKEKIRHKTKEINTHD